MPSKPGLHPPRLTGTFAAIMMIVGILTGRTVEDFAVGDHGICSLTISGGYLLSQEALLRYVGTPDVFISAADHNHQFGLPAPYNAEEAIRRLVSGRVIRQVDVAPDSGDLTLQLDGGRIEIICTSAGYEAYQLQGPDDLIMVGRGGSEEKSEPASGGNR